MFRRPRADETQEDLVKEEEALKSQGTFRPAAKIIKVNKRKTEEDQSAQKAQDEEEKPRSKFAQERNRKKKKEGIVDNTVLKEAVAKEKTVAVLGRIVERIVPAEESLREWHPDPSPYGFPQVPTLECLDGAFPSSALHFVPGMKKPSLYKQQLLKKGLVKERSASSSTASDDVSMRTTDEDDARLSSLGNESFVMKDKTVIQEEDAKKIHKENMAKIAKMSHEERLREQQEIMSNLTPEQLGFLKSLRKAKENAEKIKTNEAQLSHFKKEEVKSEAMECETSETSRVADNKIDVSPTIPPLPQVKEDKPKVRFSEEVEMKEVPMDEEVEDLEKMGIPIPLSESNKWLHMSKVEVEKLRALTDMPAPKPLKNKEGFVARFDFEGNILPYDKNVSHLEGLHHHGQEAGRAGYALDEIFVFSRSEVLQQRHLGLRTLANILRNAKEGMYDTCVSPPIIQLTVEAGAILILRFALDDTSELVYKEAVRGLYYLIASEPDEQCLSMAEPWVPGGLEPGISSEIHANDKARSELDKEEEELKDIEIIKLDVVRALMRMDTQARLRYLLGLIKPGPETVIQIIGILTRIARHSLTAAWKLSQTPHLLSTIVENFLPHNLSPLLTGENVISMTNVYGVPLKHALHFLRVLAAKGRQLASVLVNTHGIMSQVLTYVSLEPSEVSMPLQEALMLSQEAYALWATLLAYGINKAQEAFTSFYPMLVRQLVFYRDKVSVSEETENNKFNYDVGSYMLDVMTRAVNVAATHSLLKNKMTLNQGTLVDAEGKSIVLPPPLLTWDDMNDFPPLVETCLHKWLTQLMRSNQTTTFSALRLIGSCCHFLECYYSKWKDQTSYSGDVCNGKIQNIYSNMLSPFLKSTSLKHLLNNLVGHSILISELPPGSMRDPVNLGSLGCVTHGGKIVPVVQSSSPFPLLLPLTSLCVTLHSLHPVLDGKATTTLSESEEIISYLSKFCQSVHKLSGQWLTRVEVHFLYNILQLGVLKGGCNKRQVFHESAMCVLPCIHKGDEMLIKELLNSVICAPEFLSDVTEVSARVNNMDLNDYVPLKSPALVQPVLSPLQLTNSICQSLKSIGSELVSCLVSKKEYEASVVLKNGIPFITNGITINQSESPLALEKYWPLLPIKQVFNTSRQTRKASETGVQQTNSSDQSPPEDIHTVTRCLQMTYLALKYRRNCFLLETTTFAWLQHLSLVFLVANDMFLDANISSYLQGCVVELLRNKGYANLEVNNHLKGFNSCIAWFKEMLEQFMGVSYGDSTFALFLLIPVQQYWPIEFRMELWGDMADALPYVFLSPEQVTQFIPMEQFCEPSEEDEGLIIKYRSKLGQQIISERRNSFLYRLASHHVRNYLERQAANKKRSG